MSECGKIMEVRSHTEKCGAAVGTGVKVPSAAATAASATPPPLPPSSEKSQMMSSVVNETNNNKSKEKGQYQSKTTVNVMNSSKMTKDERLVAELKSQIPDVDKHFNVHRRIGEGTFSTVFLTSLKCHDHVPTAKKRFFALKYLIPTCHPKRVAQELRCLKEIGGKENVVGVELCLRHEDAIAFIMPYIPHDRFQDYFHKLTVTELQDFMRNLLIALRHVHSFGVIHRDVKPSNFLHDRKNNRYLLVDFGLAQSLDDSINMDGTKSLKSFNHRDVNANQLGQQQKQKQQQQQQQQQQREQEVPDYLEKTAVDLQTTVRDNVDDDDDNNEDATKNKRKATEFQHETETENKQFSNAPKRLRYNDGNNNNNNNIAASNSTSITNNNEHTSQQEPDERTHFYIPSPKSPLKQSNEISTPKLPKTGAALDSPLTRHIKSAVLSYSINSKIHNQRDSADASAVSPNDDKKNNNDASISAPTKATNITTTPTVNSKTPKTPTPEQSTKYKVDNRRSTAAGLYGQNNCVKCYCYGRPTVCNICIVKREIHAQRQGTPGYRPGEVLLKYPHQTTAVDIWAAGVILISILSGCYPFFKGSDDLTALAEIITVFGDEIVRKAALAMDRNICISRKKRPLHLRKLCLRLRNRCNMPPPIQNTPFNENTINASTNIDKKYCENCEQMLNECLCQHSDFNMDFTNDTYPDSVYDLLTQLLAINPNNRISAADALQHKFFQEVF